MRQADRLNAIIDDLLSLSRIERETRHDEIRLELSPLRPVLASSVQVCEVEAAQKNIRLRVECSPDLRAPINPHLLEQAVVNLLTNAIKYSPEGSPVLLGAEREDGEITVWVKDEGCGISKQHQARLFERFYRVDKARSCKLGGTGLGLSIVKHIALAHGGSVSVQSAPERGSVFCIHLPAQPQDRASPAAE
jgi:two-component system phosphate regulon sensor histidine kinase PhoR